jgi:hypothetical protein
VAEKDALRQHGAFAEAESARRSVSVSATGGTKQAELLDR